MGKAIDSRRRRLFRGREHDQDVLRLSSVPSRHPRPKTSPPSSDKISRPPIPLAPNREDGPTHKPRL